MPNQQRVLTAVFAVLLVAFGAPGATHAQPGSEKDPSKPASKQEPLAQAWSDLLDGDPAAVARATLLLSKTPDPLIAFLKGRLPPVKDDADRVQKLIEQLDDGNFQVRTEAEQQLEYLGKVIKPRLEKALAAKPPAEVQRQLKELLRKAADPEKPKPPPPPLPAPGKPIQITNANGKIFINGVALERYLTPPVLAPGPSPQWIRAVRAIAVLESIGTAEAVRFLENLADGDADSLPTIEARAALARLKKK